MAIYLLPILSPRLRTSSSPATRTSSSSTGVVWPAAQASPDRNSSIRPVSCGRRVVKVSGGYIQKIDPRHHYAPHELKDKDGRPVKIKTMPERTKGNFFQFLGLNQSQRSASAPISTPQSIFEGHRTPVSHQIITEQVTT